MKMGNLFSGGVGSDKAKHRSPGSLHMNYIWPLLIIIFSNTLLAVILIFVGLIGYHEQISWSKVLGVAICLVGLYFINKK